jgi:hypothetical protein
VLEELPTLALDLAHSEEIEEDHVVKLEPFRLVDSETEHTLHEFREFLLHSLLTDDDYLTGAEVRSDYSGIERVLGSRSLSTIVVVFDN